MAQNHVSEHRRFPYVSKKCLLQFSSTLDFGLDFCRGQNVWSTGVCLGELPCAFSPVGASSPTFHPEAKHRFFTYGRGLLIKFHPLNFRPWPHWPLSEIGGINVGLVVSRGCRFKGAAFPLFSCFLFVCVTHVSLVSLTLVLFVHVCVSLVLHVSRVGHVLRHMPVRVRSVHMLFDESLLSLPFCLEFNFKIFKTHPPTSWVCKCFAFDHPESRKLRVSRGGNCLKPLFLIITCYNRACTASVQYARQE